MTRERQEERPRSKNAEHTNISERGRKQDCFTTANCGQQSRHKEIGRKRVIIRGYFTSLLNINKDENDRRESIKATRNEKE
jgi:hypothetical protein